MKKKMLLRALLGFPIGIAIGQCMSLLSSAIISDGRFWGCTPSVIEAVGSELGAVALQTLLCGLMGAACAGGSVIWETDWGIVKQTGAYFLLLAVVMLPIAYFTEWMQHTLGGFLLYFGIFLAVFVIMWVIQYLAWKGRIKRLNEQMKEV